MLSERKHFLVASNSTIKKARALRKRMTPEERELWGRLRKRSLGVHFRKQTPFGPYILDFFCFSTMLAVEVDGSQHSTKKGIAYDARRTEYLEERGISVLRIPNADVRRNIDGVLSRIMQECEKRGLDKHRQQIFNNQIPPSKDPPRGSSR